jgi:hypothetical protein
MPEIQLPDARTILFTPRDGSLDQSIQQLQEALVAQGVLPLEDNDRLHTLSNKRRVATVIGVGNVAPKAIILARRVTGLERRVALLTPGVRDLYAQASPGDADPHSAATEQWRQDINNGRLDVITIGPNGKTLIGADFLNDRQPYVPDEVVIAQLENPVAIQVIVDFAARGTSAERT